jgi:S-adenosylmethionine synthetase
MSYIHFTDEPNQDKRIAKLRNEVEKLGGSAMSLESMPADMEEEFLGADTIDPGKLEKALPEMVDGCTPRAIRQHLGLNKAIYARTAAYGHFGRQPDNEGGFSWERDSLVEQLRRLS